MISTKDKIKDWTSMKWHSTHNWRTGTGKFLKRIMNRKIRYKKIDIDKYKK
jgi:hypothetical protein